EAPGEPPLSDDPGFERRFLVDDPYRVILPRRHRLAGKREVELADLAEERFMGPPIGLAPSYRAMLDRLCADAGFAPDIRYIVQDFTVGRALVGAGLSIAFITDLAVDEPRPDVHVRPVRGLHLSRGIYAVWLRGRRVPAIPAMVAALGTAATARL